MELGPIKDTKWTVLAADANPKYVLCRCECGREVRVNKGNIRQGKSKSCINCWPKHSRTHGMSGTKTYKLWQSMFNRVSNYKHYEKLGITICDRWKGADGFANFLADMGECPDNKKSLDRYPDPFGNYEPGNCRWADDSEQQRNKTNTRFYEYDGRRQSAAGWAEEFGLPLTSLTGRLERGWPIERALTEPLGRRRGRGAPQAKDRLIEYKGKMQTLAQWAVEFNLNLTTMIERTDNEWPMAVIESTPQGSRGGHTKAKARNAILRGDPRVVEAGSDLLQYLTPDEVRRILTATIGLATKLQLERMMNAVHGGDNPPVKLADTPATKFSVRD